MEKVEVQQDGIPEYTYRAKIDGLELKHFDVLGRPTPETN